MLVRVAVSPEIVVEDPANESLWAPKDVRFEGGYEGPRQRPAALKPVPLVRREGPANGVLTEPISPSAYGVTSTRPREPGRPDPAHGPARVDDRLAGRGSAQAAQWADRFTSNLPPWLEAFRRQAAGHAVRCAVGGASHALIPDPDVMLRRTLVRIFPASRCKLGRLAWRVAAAKPVVAVPNGREDSTSTVRARMGCNRSRALASRLPLTGCI
jgi:hypothetical protein